MKRHLREGNVPSRRREAHAAPGEGWGLAVRPRLQRVLLPDGCSGGSAGAAGAIREFAAAPEPPAAPAASAGGAVLLFCLKLSSLQPALAESLGLGPLSFCWAPPGPQDGWHAGAGLVAHQSCHQHPRGTQALPSRSITAPQKSSPSPQENIAAPLQEHGAC